MTHRRDGRPLNLASWQRLRKRVLVRDGYRCRYCGKAATTADHVLPPGSGGAELSDDNLVAACAPCNRSKGARTLEEWRAAGQAPRARPRTIFGHRPASPGCITGDYTRKRE
jgi:5-methylcytosine-specific restriction endonuclease McrA